MLTKFFNQWNPFNLCGTEVKFEDIICNPLKSTETLRQDSQGHCRRIKFPPLHCSLWEKFLFKLQIYLNKKGHLEAIDKMISFLYNQLLHHPPHLPEELQDFNRQLDQLHSLQNDGGFLYFKQGDPKLIEGQINQIKQQAYSLFIHYHQQQVMKEEELRKEGFILFQQNMEQKIKELHLEYLFGLNQTRLFLVVSSEYLQTIFEKRIQSLRKRFNIIKSLECEVTEMEKILQGKFTIPYVEDYFCHLRLKLSQEVQKIGIETESIIGNVMTYYRVMPFKKEVKNILSSIHIDPEEHHFSNRLIKSFDKEVNRQIQQIQRIFNSIF